MAQPFNQQNAGSVVPAAPNSVSNPNFDQYITTGGIGSINPNTAGMVQALMNTENPNTNAGAGIKPVTLLPSRIGPMAIPESGLVPNPIGRMWAGGVNAQNPGPYVVSQTQTGYFQNNPVLTPGGGMPFGGQQQVPQINGALQPIGNGFWAPWGPGGATFTWDPNNSPPGNTLSTSQPFVSPVPLPN